MTHALQRADVLYSKGQLAAALPLYQQALQANPEDVQVLYRSMLTLMAMRKYADCAAWLQQLIPHINHDQTPPWLLSGFYYNLGVSHEASGGWKEAARAFRSALKYDPQGIMATIELGSLAYREGVPEQGARLYRNALAIEHAEPDAMPARAFVKLLHGDYLGGFTDYETRWKLPQTLSTAHIPKNHFRWKGKDLAGKRIVVTSEQGVGDTILMARYLPLIEERGGKVTLVCQGSLVSLFRYNFPTIEVIEQGKPYRPARWWVSLMSCPYVFGTTVETVPPAPYLKAPGLPKTPPPTMGGMYAMARSMGEAMYGPPGPPFKRIGWQAQGNPLYMADHDRSAPRGAFDGLLATPGVEFVNLDDHRALDMAGLADLFMTLDLVITVDTAARHLAGALGVPCWLLAQCGPYWVDGLGDVSPWYPTSEKLFRRKSVGAWPELMERVTHAVEAL